MDCGTSSRRGAAPLRCRAAWLGDAAAVGEYAAAGGDVDARDRKKQTPLQFAAGAVAGQRRRQERAQT